MFHAGFVKIIIFKGSHFFPGANKIDSRAVWLFFDNADHVDHDKMIVI